MVFPKLIGPISGVGAETTNSLRSLSTLQLTISAMSIFAPIRPGARIDERTNEQDKRFDHREEALAGRPAVFTSETEIPLPEGDPPLRL